MASPQPGDHVPDSPRPEDPTVQMEGPNVADSWTIGPYRLVEKIGQGGMGEVWLAEQKQPLRRRVAIKLIKAGMDTREVVARFESERQALALMDHPAIAKVFDGGSTPEGRPYFVMEYVTGIPITKYCDAHKLTIRKRLELFVKVCEGVQHAHQKAIIHRDLKPSNILVGEMDGKPMPRIIDFGVAKAASQQLTSQTMFTRVGAFVGTPGYISPEQADPTGQDVDTRTDVYSLGVVLYELLVGALPHDFKKVALEDIPRCLREQEAQSPSTRLRTLGEQSISAAQCRSTDPPSLVRQVRGDLDAITLKALEKDRSRRYATTSELAADIGKYMRHEAVMARRAGTGYRALKYIRRHRIGVSVAASIAVVLVTFAGAQAFQLERITRERDRANRERDRANRITDFMTGMFKVSAPGEARGNSITAREIIDKASKEIGMGLARDPELQAQMMDVMGTVYRSLGLYSNAHSLLQRSADIRTRVLGLENPETLLTRNHLARTLFLEGRYAEAEKLNRQTLEIERRALGPEHPQTLLSMDNLAAVLREEGSYSEAEKLHREALNLRRRIQGPEHLETVRSMDNLAGVLTMEGHYPEAEKLMRETVEVQRRVQGPEHPATLISMSNFANVLSAQGNYPGAEKVQSEAVDILRRVLGPEHPETLGAAGNLGEVLGKEGRYAEAEKLFRETAGIQRRVQGPEHPDTLLSMSNLADILGKEGRYAEAEKLLRQTVDIQRRSLGPDHPSTASSIYNLAVIALHKGKRNEALSLLRESVNHGLPPSQDLFIEKDPDLKLLFGDPRFATLVAHAKERAAAVQMAK